MKARKILALAVCFAFAIGALGNCYAAGTAHDIVKIYLASGDQRRPLPPFDNVIDTTTVVCPDTVESSTLALSVMDEICGPGLTSWQIIALVDGIPVNKNPVEQPVSTLAPCVTGNWLGQYPVATGSHDVQLVTYVPLGRIVEQGAWSVNYTVTTP